MTDKEYVEFMIKCANIPYKDYSWLKDHCYRTLKRPCSPNTRNEHLAILDLIKEHEERQWIPVSEGLPKVADCYTVTRQIGSDLIVDACYFDGIGNWHNDKQINHERNYLTNVVAWMPPPNPYQGRK